MNFEDLNDPVLLEKIKAAKTREELEAIASENGFDLSDEALDSVAGGGCPRFCPRETRITPLATTPSPSR